MENAEKNSFESVHHLKAGEALTIGTDQYEVEKVEDASHLAKTFGLEIDRYVPIYFLKGMSRSAQGGYNIKSDFVVIFENMTDQTTLEHELIHVVEYQFVPTPELEALWHKAQALITEDSFDGNFVSFNFTRNIHEFIADGKTKLAPVLKKVGLWDDFVRETQYIFGNIKE